MHYIIGTSFAITPNPKLGIRDKRFKPGQAYTLIYISKKDDKAVYTFLGMDRSKVVVEFNSCREADAFISKFRNERIPDYENQLSPVIDNVAD